MNKNLRNVVWNVARSVAFGSVLMMSCSGDLRTLATNIVKLASDQIDEQDDISFGDWIASEISDE